MSQTSIFATASAGTTRLLSRLLCAAGIAGGLHGAALAAVQPHKALYSMSLESAKSSSGLIGASGTLSYQWADTCNGWTIEQNYKLVMQYQEQQPVAIESNYVTWESKDGRRYRFNQRELRNGDLTDDIHGEATLDGHGGLAKFVMARPKNFSLTRGSLFPTTHTLDLIRRAETGQHFFLAHVFDGSTIDGTSTVSAVIAPTSKPKETTSGLTITSPLLTRPSWLMWLSFFSDAAKDQQPDYSLEMRLLDNGVSSEMTIDYGDYVLKADLLKIQALSKPVC